LSTFIPLIIHFNYVYFHCQEILRKQFSKFKYLTKISASSGKVNCIVLHQASVLTQPVSEANQLVTGYGLEYQMIRVWFPAGAGNFTLHHHIQTNSGAHPASYPVSTGSSFSQGKAARHEADHSPLSSAKVKEHVELYLHSPSTSSWHDAYLRIGTTYSIFRKGQMLKSKC